MIGYGVISYALKQPNGSVRTNWFKVLVLCCSASRSAGPKGPKGPLAFSTNFLGWGASGANIWSPASPTTSAIPRILFDDDQGSRAIYGKTIKKTVSVHVRFCNFQRGGQLGALIFVAKNDRILRPSNLTRGFISQIG
jgi:hypothetical protein